ncbi:MAG: DMT family transporter [bacterium]|nr:DMT family transporter [bacterium]
MGELFALLAAMTWGIAVIMFRKSGETMSPFELNLFRVVISVAVFLAIMICSDMPLWGVAPLRDYGILAISGIIGIAISDLLFHRCLNLVGAGVTAIINCCYSPFIAIFAYLLLKERLNPQQIVGMGLVLFGILVASRVQLPVGASRGTLLKGIALGLGAMASVALAIVIAKPVLERTPVLWATTVRQLSALAVLLPVAALSPRRREILSIFRPNRTWRFSLTGTIFGSCLALLFWVGGMKYSQAGAAAILNQTSTIYVLLFAALFLKEKFTRRKAVATALAVSGILLVTLT